MHVKHAGIKVFKADTQQIRDHINDDYNSEIDNIKISQDGQFILYGCPNVSKIFFSKFDCKTLKIQQIEVVDIEYDHFETDDNMTVIVFTNNTLKTLELYAIKWIFDTT